MLQNKISCDRNRKKYIIFQRNTIPVRKKDSCHMKKIIVRRRRSPSLKKNISPIGLKLYSYDKKTNFWQEQNSCEKIIKQDSCHRNQVSGSARNFPSQQQVCCLETNTHQMVKSLENSW